MAKVRFVWHDLMTPDPEKAKDFYTKFFGWTAQPRDMGEMGAYTMLGNAGQDFGGIVHLDPAHGHPPHWMVYLQMPGDIDDACARIKELGGQVPYAPFPIPEVGRTAVAIDPQGAAFSPYQPAMEWEPASGMGMPPRGGVAWHELMTSDPAAAAEFYTTLTDLTSTVQDMGTGPYTLLMDGQEYVGGIMKLPEPSLPPGWVVYYEIAHDSIEDAMTEVTRLGGQVFMGPMEVPTVGSIAAVADSTGAMFALMKSAPVPAGVAD
jgi:predicted enzyme related to lactoylglutathione lyase